MQEISRETSNLSLQINLNYTEKRELPTDKISKNNYTQKAPYNIHFIQKTTKIFQKTAKIFQKTAKIFKKTAKIFQNMGQIFLKSNIKI